MTRPETVGIIGDLLTQLDCAIALARQLNRRGGASAVAYVDAVALWQRADRLASDLETLVCETHDYPAPLDE